MVEEKQKYKTRKVPVIFLPLENEILGAEDKTAENLMASELRTCIMRSLTVRQQLVFILCEFGYHPKEIYKNLPKSRRAIYDLRHRIRKISEKILKNGYN